MAEDASHIQQMLPNNDLLHSLDSLPAARQKRIKELYWKILHDMTCATLLLESSQDKFNETDLANDTFLEQKTMEKMSEFASSSVEISSSHLCPYIGELSMLSKEMTEASCPGNEDNVVIFENVQLISEDESLQSLLKAYISE